MLNSSLVDDYVNWLRKQYRVNNLGDTEEIVTPFTNSIGDNITIYVSSNPDNSITLTDDFDTLGDLEMMGINLAVSTREKYLKNVLKDYGVQCVDKELFITGSKADFPKMKQRLVEAIIHIDDIFMTRKENITNIFKEEVYDYFDKNDFGGLKTYRPYGASGNDYVVDYTIPQKTNRPFRFINFTNTSSFSNIATAGATYGDISNGQEYSLKNSEFIIIYNSKQANPSDKSINIANQYNLRLIPWDDKKQILTLR